jgi:hypothetical protein
MFQTPKQQVLFLGFSALLAAFSLGSILVFSDPQTAGIFTFLFLYASVFILTLGIFTLIGLFLREWLWPGLYVVNLSNSFRQALFIAILVAVSLILLSKRLLFWWVEGSLILFFVFMEAFLNLKV